MPLASKYCLPLVKGLLVLQEEEHFIIIITLYQLVLLSFLTNLLNIEICSQPNFNNLLRLR